MQTSQNELEASNRALGFVRKTTKMSRAAWRLRTGESMGKKDRHWIGFDLGGTKMLAKVFGPEFQKLGQSRTKTRGYEGAEAGVNRIIKTIKEALSAAELDKQHIAGIGIGCPGPLNLETGVILNTANLGWTNVPIKETLEDEFDRPVFIMNDVDAGVYGEYRFGAASGARTAVGVFPGTGIGGGCVYDGKILRGKTSSCMEIGHIQVDPSGPLCGCGKRGCLEAVASRLVIAQQVAAAAYRGQAPHLLKNVGTDLQNIRSGALANSIEHGDKQVEVIVREAANQLGIGVANIVNLMAPDVVVLGGGLVKAMPKLYVTEVARSAKSRVMDSMVDSFRIVAAELGDDAGVLGAAAWAEHRLDTAT